MGEHLFVVTGGPGSGKSSLIAALARRGVATMPEAGRAIIQDQVRIGGQALPWADRALYAELMLAWELRSYQEAARLPGLVLMDRGIPDVIGYLNLSGLPVPSYMEAAARLHRYNTQVFLAPYWPDIFIQDAERKQDSREAEATARIMQETYTRLGYEIITLPLADIETRADFLLQAIRRA